jgi:hypothetical protein
MLLPLRTSARRCLLAALVVLVLPVSAADASAAKLTGPITAFAPAPPRDIPRDIVRIAQGEFAKGVREVPMGSNNSAEIARYRSALIPHARGGAWCAYFASWVTRQAGVPIGPRGDGFAGAAGIAAWARRTGRWRRVPAPGDIAVYVGHTGIVASVSGSRMTTIEGNWSDRVSRLDRSRYEALGFARIAVGDHPTRSR